MAFENSYNLLKKPKKILLHRNKKDNKLIVI